uniref:GK21797 n=1 Tax=Drosophila willistoni TaxID=7260 RepID=B4MPZ0_DROWI
MALSINKNVIPEFSLKRLFLLLFLQFSAKVRMTNAVCESYNKSWVTFEQCRLKAVNRNKTIINIIATIHHPAKKIHLKLEVLKKANGYKPWLFSQVIDACAFMKRSNNPVMKMVHGFYKDFSTINHTCPYVGLQEVKDFYVRPEQMPVPLPTGDYALFLTWLFSDKPQFMTNVYFTFEEDLLKQ